MTARVLIVDDDPVQRRLLDNMVRKFGHEPAIAESGDQAAALLTGGERFDCVVLDLVMPDLDGLGVLARMREAGSTVPVIVQTAHGGIDNVVSAMRAGAVDFVVKPVGAERLAGVAPQRAGKERARRRARPHQAQPVRHADVQGHRHPQPEDAGGAAQRREGRGVAHPGAGRGRVRRRQGADRARHPRPGRAARQALRRGQLRRDPRQSRGVDPVRPREGRLHRRDREARRQVRRSLRRHAVPRRGRRIAAGGAGEAAARHPGGRGRAGRRRASPSRSTCGSSRPPTAT